MCDTGFLISIKVVEKPELTLVIYEKISLIVKIRSSIIISSRAKKTIKRT